MAFSDFVSFIQIEDTDGKFHSYVVYVFPSLVFNPIGKSRDYVYGK